MSVYLQTVFTAETHPVDGVTFAPWGARTQESMIHPVGTRKLTVSRKEKQLILFLNKIEWYRQSLLGVAGIAQSVYRLDAGWMTEGLEFEPR
jgi:hypothetical protein